MRRAPALASVALALAACGGRQAPAPAADATPGEGTATAAGAPAEETLPKATITLYFPSADADGLVAETREIVDTARPAERGTQVLVALLAGPQGKGALPAVPEGTTLRQLWVGRSGVAWADFSEELSRGLGGGSAEELRTVYAIVDSLAANVPQISRVGLLVGGRERDTLGGHVDLRRPLSPDAAVAATPGAAPGE